MDGYVNRTQFAQIYGCSKPYVTQLVTQKRLVLSEDGKLINVEASLRLLDVTSDPSKAGVRERWQAFRDGRPFDGVASGVGIAAAQTHAPADETAAPAATSTELDFEAVAPAASSAGASKQSSAYHDARTMREQAQAEMAQIELAKAQGRALDGESVGRAIADVITWARTEVQLFRDRLTPLVAPITDQRRVYDTIDAETQRLLERLATRCQAAAQAGGPQA